MAINNICFKKTLTTRSTVSLLWIVQVFLKQMLSRENVGRGGNWECFFRNNVTPIVQRPAGIMAVFKLNMSLSMGCCCSQNLMPIIHVHNLTHFVATKCMHGGQRWHHFHADNKQNLALLAIIGCLMLVYDRNSVSVSRTETQLRYPEQKPRSTFRVGIGPNTCSA